MHRVALAWCAALWLFPAGVAWGQIERLPPIGERHPAGWGDPFLLARRRMETPPLREDDSKSPATDAQAGPAGYPREFSESPTDGALFRPGALEESPSQPEPAESARPRGSKPGVFQQASLTATWMPSDLAEPGVADVDLYLTFALPCPTEESPLVLTPEIELQYLDGPTAAELPPRLYDASFQIRYMRKLSPRWGMDLAASPGWHGDFAENDPNAFRIPGRGVAVFDWGPCAKVILGAAYLDREDVGFLPVAGLIWTPADDTRLELTVPRPRFARRIDFGDDWERWIYVAGEFGGGSYAVERGGGRDVATLSDLRLILGFEEKRFSGISGRYELGYVFNRKIEYAGGATPYEPGDTLLLRAGATY